MAGYIQRHLPDTRSGRNLDPWIATIMIADLFFSRANEESGRRALPPRPHPASLQGCRDEPRARDGCKIIHRVDHPAAGGWCVVRNPASMDLFFAGIVFGMADGGNRLRPTSRAGLSCADSRKQDLGGAFLYGDGISRIRFRSADAER